MGPCACCGSQVGLCIQQPWLDVPAAKLLPWCCSVFAMGQSQLMLLPVAMPELFAAFERQRLSSTRAHLG